jgi:uncharacterized membrane protein
MNRTGSTVALALGSFVGAPALGQTQTFEPLGDLAGGAVASRALAVSADGSVVVGIGTAASGERPFRWTHADGMSALPLLGGMAAGRANGVSGDGAVIVGRCGDRSVRWVGVTPSDLVTFGDGEYSAANGISADGLAIVGNAFNGDFSLPDTWPYRWTSTDGSFQLGPTTVTADNFEGFGAIAASSDGSVIVGNEGMPFYQAFRWTSADGVVGLGFLPFGPQMPSSSAAACSSDGSVLAGWSISVPGKQAIRWTSAGGMVGLGDLPGGDFNSEAMGISGDGRIIVGRGRSANGDEAFIWNETDGMQPLAAVLAAIGAPEATGWTLTAATGISADGRTIVGYGTNPLGGTEAWVARLPGATTCYPNCDGSTTPPVLNTLDFSCFIDRFNAGDSYANCDGSTTAPVLNILDFMCFLNRFIAGCS